MKFKYLFVFVFVSCLCASAVDRQANNDYRQRRVKLAEAMNGGTLVLFAPTEAEGPNNLFGFRQNDDFYYLTGWSEPGAAVMIAPAGDSHPYTEILFLPAHNVTQEKWTGPKLGPESPDAPKLTGFDRVEVLDKIHEELVKVLPQPRAIVYSEMGDNSAS